MPKKRVSLEEFVELFEQYGANETARRPFLAINSNISKIIRAIGNPGSLC